MPATPKRSRLMHGAGIVSLGFVMDAISDRHRQTGPPSKDQFREDLEPLRDVCCWTDGHWEFGPGAMRKWKGFHSPAPGDPLSTESG